MKEEVYRELKKLAENIIARPEVPELPAQLREAQMLYETLLIANYLSEKDRTAPNPPPVSPAAEAEAPTNPKPEAQSTPGPALPPEPKPPNRPQQKKPANPSAAADSPKAEANRSEEPPKTSPPLPPKREAETVVGPAKSASLNDRLGARTLEIGLNDRIAFVKHLFGGSQEDFNRVLSQLNTMGSLAEAEAFLQNLVKPDYDWSDKEEYEARLMQHVYRKFGEE